MTDHTATSAAYMVGGTRAIFAGAGARDPPGAVERATRRVPWRTPDPPGARPARAPARVPLCWPDSGATSPILHGLCDS